MSVKKLLVLTAAGIASVAASAAFAGGPDVMAPPAPAWQPNIWLEGDIGYARTDWRRQAVNPFVLAGLRNGRGGFTYGFDIGYMFYKYLGVEFGWFSLPRVRGTASGNNPWDAATGLRLTSWFFYLALKISVPLFDNVNAFGKIGGVYRALRWRGTVGGLSTRFNRNYWNVYLAVGIQYHFDPNWSVKVTYIHIPRRFTPIGASTRNAPNVNMYTAGLAYHFAV